MCYIFSSMCSICLVCGCCIAINANVLIKLLNMYCVCIISIFLTLPYNDVQPGDNSYYSMLPLLSQDMCMSLVPSNLVPTLRNDSSRTFKPADNHNRTQAFSAILKMHAKTSDVKQCDYYLRVNLSRMHARHSKLSG